MKPRSTAFATHAWASANPPKGVNAEDGVVFLRGVMERPEDIEHMEAATRRIAGVRGVENLVHGPGTPAPASRPKLERERSGRGRVRA